MGAANGDNDRHADRHATLLELSDALYQVSDVVEALQVALGLACQRFGVVRAAYLEYDPNQIGFVTRASVAEPEAVALPELINLADYGAGLEAIFRQGCTLSVADVDVDPRTGSQSEVYRAIGTRAWVGVPLVKQGELEAILVLHSPAPRTWTRAEIELLEGIAERTWAAVGRARAENALRESEERYRRIVSTANEGIWVVDADARTTYANAKMAQMLGCTVPELHKHTIFDFVFEEDRAAVLAAREKRRSGVQEEFDFRYRRRDGSEFWAHVATSPIFDRQGVFSGAFAMLTDVTDRKRAESALRASEERLHKMTNVQGVGVLTFSEQGRLLDANHTFLQMHGYTREDIEARTMTWLDLTPNEYVAESERQMQKLAATGRIGPYEKAYVRKDGSRSWLLFAGAAIGDGTIVEYCIDVSGKKRSEARYRTLFESIEQGFCILQVMLDGNGRGVDYRFLEVNPAFERHTGLFDPVGKTARELIPHLEPRWPEIYGRVATTGRREQFVDHSVPMGRWFDVDAFQIGEPGELKVALLFSDITDRIQAERRQMESDRRKDEFLAVLGHELRNPLAPIRTGLNLLERARKNPDLLDSLQPMMQRQVTHLTRLVDDLLDMARVSRGTIELRQAPLDLNHTVEAAIEQVRSLLSERGHTLALNLCKAPLPVHGDFERLTQVVANLLSNAGKYTKPGGTITVCSEADRDRAVLRVSDTGYGIPAERLDEVFEMFAQVPEHRTMDGGSGGLGIGLALARQLVELHGGQIDATSRGLGHGSEFTLQLPLSPSEHRTVPTQPSLPPRAPRRILVVDDNVDAAESLGMLLSLEGHTVRLAHDGPRALQVLEEFIPETVLLDLGMPGWDGIEVARRIRGRSQNSGVQLVAVTGWGQEKDHNRTRAAGFDHHLTKPVDIEDLLSLIQKAGMASQESTEPL